AVPCFCRINRRSRKVNMTGRLDKFKMNSHMGSIASRRNIVRVAHLKAYGDPSEVIEVVEVSEPRDPGADEVLVAVNFAPINPADLLLAMGLYVVKPPLPSLLGNEGVGTVLAAGTAVRTVGVGDRVALPSPSYTWRERMVVPAAGLRPLPREAPLEQ